MTALLTLVVRFASAIPLDIWLVIGLFIFALGFFALQRLIEKRRNQQSNATATKASPVAEQTGTPDLATGEVESEDTEISALKAEITSLKSELEEYKERRLTFEIDTRAESSVILISNNGAHNAPGREQPTAFDEYIIKAFLKIRFKNRGLQKTTIESMALSLHSRRESGEDVEIPLEKHILDIYPKGKPTDSVNQIYLTNGLPVEAGSITPYYWFWYHLEVPRKQVKNIGSGHTLRLTMNATEYQYGVDILVDWERARNHKTYILSQNVGSIPSS